jgi:hypothetical protein
MTKHTWKKILAIALVGHNLIGFGAIAKRAQAVTMVSDSQVLAQASASNCRVPNRVLDLYALPSVASDSASLATLQPNTRINLNRNADGSFVQENGFIRGYIPSADLTGYVIARHLTRIPGCGQDGSTPPPSPQATCARVAVTELVVRANPSETAPLTGQVVTNGQEIRILDDAVENATGRTWVQISIGGSSGWIAETGRNGVGRNLSQRYSCRTASTRTTTAG